MRPLDHGRVQAAVEGQVKLARRRGKNTFVAAVRKFGHLILSDEFIARVLSVPKKRRTPGGSISDKSRRVMVVPGTAGVPTRVPCMEEFPPLSVKAEVKVEGTSVGEAILISDSEVEVEGPAEVPPESRYQEGADTVRLSSGAEDSSGMMGREEGNGVSVMLESAPTGKDTGLDLSEMEVDIPVGEGPGSSSVVEETGGQILEWRGAPAWAGSDFRAGPSEEIGQDGGRSRAREREKVPGGSEVRDRSRSQLTEESPVEGRRKETGKECPICHKRVIYRRKHVEDCHFPTVFRGRTWDKPHLDGVRLSGVMCIIKNLGFRSIDEAMIYLHRLPLAIPADSCLYERDRERMERICRRFLWHVPDEFHVPRVNSRALLFHWRVLAAMLCLGNESLRANFFNQRFKWRGGDPVKDLEQVLGRAVVTQVSGTCPQESSVESGRVRVEVREAEVVPESGRVQLEVREVAVAPESGRVQLEVRGVAVVPESGRVQLECDMEVLGRDVVQEWECSRNVVPSAFDSHFHLDRSGRVLQVYSLERLIGHAEGPVPEVPVQVSGGVAVFCDPATYPEVYPCAPGFGSAVGLHPKKPHASVEGAVRLVEEELRKEGVVALGEIGLDWTTPEQEWPLQERMFVGLLELACPRRPVILHLRGQDRYSSEVSALALRLMRENTSPTQRVHLHCFGGNLDQVLGWSTAFPRCYFSIAGSVAQFDEIQRAAVRRIPLNRLLVETDSPYLRVQRQWHNTPAYVGEVARKVAQIRQTTLDEILQASLENGRLLYNL
ncbi:hypothetical protein DPMN_049968 [Dreissena polymorpha]|uniref:Uncharacterized protein n=2 Tax=Dreissena polymorpha TaxID=45954 RepID=A0A9D4CF95_DREPO|nr:hypothetical protein DPMN_049968 [Dreissena polymorpha]